MKPNSAGKPAGSSTGRPLASLAAVAEFAAVSESTVLRVLRGSAVVAPRTRLRVEAAMSELGFRPGEARRAGRQKGAVTMADVGDRAGVGEATVSRVINRSGIVRESTRRRVQAAIDELDYHPNATARSLSRGRAMTLGVIVPFFVRPSAVERLRGAEAEFTAAGYDTVLYNVAAPEQVQAQFTNVAAGRSDGVLVISVPPARSQVERLAASGTPVVLVDVRYPGLSQVYSDDVEGGTLATRHLLELGHRRIAFLGDPSDNLYGFTSSAHRRAGYEQAMRKAGLEVPSRHVKEGEHSQEIALELASELLALPDPPTAIFAASDTQAFGVLEAAVRAGVQVPERLSVIGFDDIEAASYLGLTTVRQPLTYSGARGARLLLDETAGCGPDQPVVEKLVLEVVSRRTTAPPPA